MSWKHCLPACHQFKQWWLMGDHIHVLRAPSASLPPIQAVVTHGWPMTIYVSSEHSPDLFKSLWGLNWQFQVIATFNMLWWNTSFILFRKTLLSGLFRPFFSTCREYTKSSYETKEDVFMTAGLSVDSVSFWATWQGLVLWILVRQKQGRCHFRICSFFSVFQTI